MITKGKIYNLSLLKNAHFLSEIVESGKNYERFRYSDVSSLLDEGMMSELDVKVRGVISEWAKEKRALLKLYHEFFKHNKKDL